MRIGIFGGSFDPPHIGHVTLAETAIRELGLDEVLFLPANRNPMKARDASSPAKHRLAMVQALMPKNEKFAVSDMEITRGGASYMVDTLSELQMAQLAEYWLIMGADTLRGFAEWKSPRRILQMARLAVAMRPPHSEVELLSRIDETIRPAIDFIHMNEIDVSSTELRKKITLKQNVTPWIDSSVLTYIQASKLYQN